jgi:hypothetical protein
MQTTISVPYPLPRILVIEKDGDDGLIVTFSDGTTAGYVVEELLMLRPRRELAYSTSNPVQSSDVATDGPLISTFHFDIDFIPSQVKQRTP